jgi:hypothetical protein
VPALFESIVLSLFMGGRGILRRLLPQEQLGKELDRSPPKNDSEGDGSQAR